MFSQKIKQLRKENNLTQSELADKLNCSLSKIGMWETNKREPTKDDLIMLANAFDISVDYLLGLDDKSQTKNKRLQNIDLENAFKNNCASYYEIAEFLNVPEKLVVEKFKYLSSKNNTGYIELGEYKIILTNLPNIMVYKEI